MRNAVFDLDNRPKRKKMQHIESRVEAGKVEERRNVVGRPPGSHRKTSADIELLVPLNPVTRHSLKRKSFLLTPDKVTTLQEKHNYPVGALNAKNGTQLVMRMAHRLAARLAKQYAPEDPVEQNAFASAWHFTLWTELCSLIPIRKIVPHIIKEAKGRSILLPIDPDNILCFNWWNGYAIEPLVLAHELSKKGQKVFLLGGSSERKSARGGANKIDFRFFLNPGLWQACEEARVPKEKAQAIFSADHVRFPEYVSQFVKDMAILGDPNAPRPYVDVLLRDRRHYPEPLEISFERTISTRGFAAFKPKTSLPSLSQGFFDLVGPLTRSAWELAKQTAANTGANEMHLCDLFMFDSALMAHAVGTQGGKLYLWPHSSNAIICPYHKKEWIARATSVTKSGRDQWKKLLDEDQTRVMSEIMLRPPSIQKPFKAGKPITVVFFGGAYRCGRMPALDFQGHLDTMRTLLHDLNDLPSNFELVLKPKHIWETERWIRSCAPTNNRFKTVGLPPRSLAFPNMVFVTASFGSSALLEGMSVGIPSFVARETAVVDYTTLRADLQQVGSIDFVIDQIRRCADGDHYRKVAERNLTWLSSETEYGQA